MKRTDDNNGGPSVEYPQSASWDHPEIHVLDNEAHAGGTVEERAMKNADTSNDWANPGSNSYRGRMGITDYEE